MLVLKFEIRFIVDEFQNFAKEISLVVFQMFLADFAGVPPFVEFGKLVNFHTLVHYAALISNFLG